jgi:hypothetical protein
MPSGEDTCLSATDGALLERRREEIEGSGFGAIFRFEVSPRLNPHSRKPEQSESMTRCQDEIYSAIRTKMSSLAEDAAADHKSVPQKIRPT